MIFLFLGLTFIPLTYAVCVMVKDLWESNHMGMSVDVQSLLIMLCILVYWLMNIACFIQSILYKISITIG
jgi:hypothetical protein